jgi:hypothetical protein
VSVIVRSINVLPSSELPAVAHATVELPEHGLTLCGVALIAVQRAPHGIAVIAPRHRIGAGIWAPSVVFADSAEFRAIAVACRQAWLERANKWLPSS